jgi:hypothetical protein
MPNAPVAGASFRASAAGLLNGAIVDLTMIVLLALGVAVLAALVWVAFSAADEQQQRQRRTDRDYDLRKR